MIVPVTFFPALSGGIILFFLLERILAALMGLFWKDSSKSGFLVCLLEFVCQAILSTIYSAFNLASALMVVYAWMFVLLIVGSVFYVTYEQSPWVWTDMLRAYNAFLGPFVQGSVIQILNLVNLVFQGLIPLWNSFFYFFSQVLRVYLLPAMVQEASTLKDLGDSLFSMGEALCLSLFNWVQTTVVACPRSLGEECFAVGPRTLDIVTPMASLREAVVSYAIFLNSTCGTAGPMIDIVTYPFMDLNLATGIHNLINFVQFAFVQVPSITVMRCMWYGAKQPLLCTPQ